VHHPIIDEHRSTISQQTSERRIELRFFTVDDRYLTKEKKTCDGDRCRTALSYVVGAVKETAQLEARSIIGN
jgi:hypothetical protein